MSLLEKLNTDMKQAMKNKDKDRLAVIRMVKSSLQNEGIKLGRSELTAEEDLTVLSRELKQRKDSLLEFQNAGRDDLAEKLNYEIEVVQSYMPAQLSEDELISIIKDAITEVNASAKSDMGKVMSAIMPKVKGKADGSLVNQLVLKHLS